MSNKKIRYSKNNNVLYKKLYNINCIKNLKYIKLNNYKNFITFDKISSYIKILNKPSTYLKVNYKELLNIKKKLKSGYIILSTPYGILTDKKSIMCKTGGTLLCYILK